MMLVTFGTKRVKWVSVKQGLAVLKKIQVEK